MDIEEIKKKIDESVRLLVEKDSDLFRGRGEGNYEVTISCKLAQYFSKEFDGFDVDCEYDKQGEDIKRESSGKRIRPDILVHKRGTNDFNLVVLEMKTKKEGVLEKDINRLKEMTDQRGEHKYKLGVFIRYERDSNSLIVRYFANAEQCGRKIYKVL